MPGPERVAVLGLGIMGRAFARNLAQAGHHVVAWNRSPVEIPDLDAAGVRRVATPADAAREAKAILVVVTDAAAVEAVLFGPRGACVEDVAGKTVLQMSTIDGPSTRRISERVVRAGAAFLDAPVAGSKPVAEAGKVIVLAGGDAALRERWRLLLLDLGKDVVAAGPVGAGTALKLCMNLIVAQMTSALTEAVALAKVQGLDPRRIFDVIRTSPALDSGYFRAKEGPLLAGDFTPQFSLENMAKDLRFVAAAAAAAGTSLPVTEAVRAVMEEGIRRGYGKDDLAGIARLVGPAPGGTPVR